MSRQLILLFCFVFALCSCSVLQTQQHEAAALHLLPPAQGPEAAILKQKLTLIADGVEHQFLVVLRLDKQQIKLRVLMPGGQTLYALDYDGVDLVQDNRSDMVFPAGDILAMIQFTLWPTPSLQEHYKPDDGWHFSARVQQRNLQYNGNKQLRVSYLSASTVLIDHYPHQYEVRIETLEYKSL